VSAVAGTRPVRAEDAFDVAAALSWLRTHTDDRYAARLAGEAQVLQFSGGASNLTYLLRCDDLEPQLDLVLRRGPSGTKAKGAHDMGREYRIQSALAPVFPYVAPMVAFCDDPSVLGGEFYVMERLVGTVPRREMPVELTPAQATRLCESMLDVLVELHSVDPVACGLDGLGKGDGYVRRQVGGWSARYRTAHTEGQPDLEGAMAWLDDHQPADLGTGVIHNDYKLDNLVLGDDDPTRIVGIFDWEMATVGDPLMDLGAALAYWVQADDDADFQAFRRVPTHLPGMLTRDQLLAGYCDRMGVSLTPQQALFYEAFGVFRLAVIAQQIYYRYAVGQTTNEAYAVFGPAVRILDRRLTRLLG
jgi:aminoglycoside phosphotransferase (APT) family kinase protein